MVITLKAHCACLPVVVHAEHDLVMRADGASALRFPDCPVPDAVHGRTRIKLILCYAHAKYLFFDQQTGGICRESHYLRLGKHSHCVISNLSKRFLLAVTISRPFGCSAKQTISSRPSSSASSAAAASSLLRSSVPGEQTEDSNNIVQKAHTRH